LNTSGGIQKKRSERNKKKGKGRLYNPPGNAKQQI